MLVNGVSFIKPHPSIPKCTSGLANSRGSMLGLHPNVANPTALGCQLRSRVVYRFITGHRTRNSIHPVRRVTARCGSAIVCPSGMHLGYCCCHRCDFVGSVRVVFTAMLKFGIGFTNRRI